MKRKNNISVSSLMRSLTYVKHYKLLIALTLIMSAIYVAASLIIPIIVGKAIDLMIEGQLFMDDVVKTLLISVVIAIIGGIAQWLMSVINNRITYLVIQDMRRDAFAKIHRLPIS